MKKQLLLIAGTVLTLASCQNEGTNAGDNQAQIDSAVNAQVEAMRMQMMLQNDSLINAEAQRRADSMIVGMQGSTKTSSSSRPATRPTTPVKPTPVNTTPTPTGKTTNDEGKPTGKTTNTQQTEGKPTGKMR